MTVVTGTATVHGQQLVHDRALRFKDRATRLAVAAAGAALTDAGLLDDGALTVPGADVGVVVSSNLGSLDTVCRVAGALDRVGPTALRTVDLPNAGSNAAASNVAIRYGLHGINLMLCNGVTSGLDAVGWAEPALAAGRARYMVVVGVEPADGVVCQLMGGVRMLDGAAALVLELPATARERGRRARAVLKGYARRRDAATAIKAVAAPGTRFGLWLPPESAVDGTGSTLAESGRSAVTRQFRPAPSENGSEWPGAGRVPRRAGAAVPRVGAGRTPRREADVAGLPGRDPCPRATPPAAVVHDLGRTLPSASGAFGVFQCVAATAWFAAGPPDGVPLTALAVAGGGSADDAASAVLLVAAALYDGVSKGEV
ncbi:beta-ketoacyl synthase [Streptomyces sp. AV19]|uniref:beta-ketoacyl synthase N-terminal-like domain-containing protein n=1 Tax=Streptomyces sp. AV19 TaxID=2793068 RepID=UPI0018FE7373|nr:beta-ketoacyl synthase N-terminal-like domain-containing protein [Streptomyces sp. AV19]MBH1934185.1 beta-ketoacyl synthase [Streptomyces sp. AV19]MDG4533552.1 beta-ketoacyl synthase [Streptomyces sp. AV19]